MFPENIFVEGNFTMQPPSASVLKEATWWRSGILRLEFFLNKKIQISNFVFCLMAIFGLFQGDPWYLPTQNWLKNATNDISIQEFHNIMAHYKPQ